MSLVGQFEHTPEEVAAAAAQARNCQNLIADLLASPAGDPGVKYALDVVVSSYTASSVRYAKAGDANKAAATRKTTKYGVFAIPAGKMIPIALETSGAVLKEADAFIKTVMRSRPFTATVDDRGRAQLVELNAGAVWQRVGTLVQR